MEIDLPDWSFKAALYICEQRMGRFGNRFPNRKIRELHAAEEYFRHCEGVTGYLGDVAAAILLDQDPVRMLTDMVEATDGLAHRDQFDLHHRGWNIDAKIEDYGEQHEALKAGGVTSGDQYGYRLINAAQYNENKGFTDIYLFGCFDPPMTEGRLLHDIKRVRWMGWVTSEMVETFDESGFIPKGPRLPARARLIPNEKLRSVEALLDLPDGDRPAPTPKSREEEDASTEERIAMLQEELRAIAS